MILTLTSGPKAVQYLLTDMCNRASCLKTRSSLALGSILGLGLFVIDYLIRDVLLVQKRGVKGDSGPAEFFHHV